MRNLHNKIEKVSNGAIEPDKLGEKKDFSAYLMEKYSQTGSGANTLANVKRGSNCKAVSNVMGKVGNQVQVSRKLDG